MEKFKLMNLLVPIVTEDNLNEDELGHAELSSWALSRKQLDARECIVCGDGFPLLALSRSLCKHEFAAGALSASSARRFRMSPSSPHDAAASISPLSPDGGSLRTSWVSFVQRESNLRLPTARIVASRRARRLCRQHSSLGGWRAAPSVVEEPVPIVRDSTT